jgi:hypothetical protein
MPVRVDIPIRLRVDPGALMERQADVEKALAAAVGRALGNSRDVVLEKRGGYVGVRVHPPEFTWTGEGVGEVNGAARCEIEAQLVSILTHTVNAAGLHNLVESKRAIGILTKRFEEALLQDKLDTAEDTYEIPSYQNASSTQVPIRQTSRRPWRGWRTLRSSGFFTTIGKYTDYMNEVVEDRTQDFANLYAELETQVKYVSLWLVRVDRTYRRDDLLNELFTRALELSRMRSNQEGLSVMIMSEPDRQRLLTIDREHRVEETIPDLSSNSPLLQRYHGEWYLLRNTLAAFTLMLVPQIRLQDYARLSPEIQVSLFYRDLEFVISPNGFQARFNVSWSGFLSEMGNQTATLRILPFEVTAAVYWSTLQELVEAAGRHLPSDRNSRLLSQFVLLNQEQMGLIPASLQVQVNGLTNPTTLARESGDRWDRWQPGWRGALFSAVFQVPPDLKFVIDYRASAQQIAAAFITLLRQYSDDLTWRFRFRDLIRDSFTTALGQEGVRTLFDLVMEALETQENGRWFNDLLDRVESSHGEDSSHFIQAATVSTRYINHARIVRLREGYNRSWRDALMHRYFPESGTIWINKDSQRVVPRRGVVADTYADYSIDRRVQRLVTAKQAAFREALEREAKQLLENIAQGRDGRTFNNQEFTNEAINRAALASHLTNDDFETVTETTSVRVTNIELRTRQGLESYFVTFNFVKRIEQGPWQDVEGTSQTVSELDFEWMLWAWGLGRMGERFQTASLVIVGIGLIAVAWEVGVIALLVDAAGGTAVVLTSIAISNILYLINPFGLIRHGPPTVEGFVLATIDGYLNALTFRAGGIAGRAIALRIGTQTMPRIIGGWIAERFVVGVVGGGLGGAAVTFSHGMAAVLLHQGSFPTLRDFVHGLTMGALLGLFGEFVVGPTLQGAFRVGGATVLNTIEAAAQVVKDANVSPIRYATEIAQALTSIHQRLSQFLEEASVREIMAALWERMATIGEALEGLPGAVRTGVTRRLRFTAYQRIFELAEVNIGRIEVDGLERLLETTEAGTAQMSQAELLSFLNAIARSSEQARNVLYALGRLSDQRVTAVIGGRQLSSMAEAATLLRNLRSRDVDLIWDVWSGNSFSLHAADFERFLSRIAAHPDEQQIVALEVLHRPDQLVTPAGVAQALEKSGLSNDVIRGLDRLYGALEAIPADTIMNTVTRQHIRRFLFFLGRLHPARAAEIAERNQFEILLEVVVHLDDRFLQSLLDQQQFMLLLESSNLLRFIISEGGTNTQRLLEGAFRIRAISGASEYQIAVREAEAFLGQVSRQSAAEQRLLVDVALGRHPGRTAVEPLLPPPTPISTASREAIALRAQAVDLERQAMELQQRAAARLNDGIVAHRSGAARGRIDRILDEAVALERQSRARSAEAGTRRSDADALEAGTRSPTELPGGEDIEALDIESTARSDGIFRTPISPFQEMQAALYRQMRRIFQSSSGNRVVFRVDAGSTSRFIEIDAVGNLRIRLPPDRGYLHVNFGSLERALEFLGKRDLSRRARIVVFEVREDWLEAVRSAAIPETGTGALRGNTQLVDVTYAHEQLAVPEHLLNEFNQAIVPRSGRILDIRQGPDGLMYIADPHGQFNVRFPGRIVGDRVVVEGEVIFNPPE